MKKFIEEDYSFTITVVDGVRNKNGAIDCRNGHEVGDTYVCEYGCPGGFCSKSMLKLFPLLEAVRAGGDLGNLVANAERHKCVFTCADGCVKFTLEAIEKNREREGAQ